MRVEGDHENLRHVAKWGGPQHVLKTVGPRTRGEPFLAHDGEDLFCLMPTVRHLSCIAKHRDRQIFVIPFREQLESTTHELPY